MKGIMIYPNEITQDNMDGMINRIHNLGFTDIFFITKNIDGRVYHSSKIAESDENILGSLCKIAGQYKINVYAWFCTFTEGYNGKLFGTGTSKFLLENPSFSAVDISLKNTFDKPVSCDFGLENYACPANLNVQEYELKLAEEIVKNFPVKGIHLDFVRYPFPGDYCYCDFCNQKFKKKFGISIHSIKAIEYLESWKQDVITKFVNDFTENLKKLNNKITVSALVWKYDDCYSKTQNWKEWSTDFLTPMFYNKSYGKNIDWINEEIEKNRNISNKDIIALIGGPYSNLYTKREWETIEVTVNSSKASGLIYGHYGLANIINTLENEDKMTYIKKIAFWKIYQLKSFLLHYYYLILSRMGQHLRKNRMIK